MNRTISVWVGASIIYLYGTVNGGAATFTLVGNGYWQATVPRTENDNYLLHLEAYSVGGLEGTYDCTLFYGMMPVVINRTGSYYTHTDLNRVGHNIDYLSGVLNGYGYSVTVDVKTDWVQAYKPRAGQMETYLDNLQALIDSYYTLPDTPAPPESMDFLTWQGANNIEQALVDIKEIIGRMENGFRYCGTFNCNQGEVILP